MKKIIALFFFLVLLTGTMYSEEQCKSTHYNSTFTYLGGNVWLAYYELKCKGKFVPQQHCFYRDPITDEQTIIPCP